MTAARTESAKARRSEGSWGPEVELSRAAAGLGSAFNVTLGLCPVGSGEPRQVPGQELWSPQGQGALDGQGCVTGPGLLPPSLTPAPARRPHPNQTGH